MTSPFPTARRALRSLRGTVATSAVALTVLAGQALAAGTDPAHGADAAHHSGGLPQLNPALFPTQLFWLAVSFATLYWLMSRKALPRVTEVLEERQARISDDLAKAGALKEEAETVMTAVEAAGTSARADAQAEIARTVAEIDRAAAERQSAQGAELAERLRASDDRIAAAKAEALANVRAAAADIARDVAARLAGVEADASTAEAAVAAAIEERR